MCIPLYTIRKLSSLSRMYVLQIIDYEYVNRQIGSVINRHTGRVASNITKRHNCIRVHDCCGQVTLIRSKQPRYFNTVQAASLL